MKRYKFYICDEKKNILYPSNGYFKCYHDLPKEFSFTDFAKVADMSATKLSRIEKSRPGTMIQLTRLCSWSSASGGPEYLYIQCLPKDIDELLLESRSKIEDISNMSYRKYVENCSNQYEYFVQGNMDGNVVKIPLEIRGSRELEDGQAIQIPGTDPARGAFKVKLYNYDAPRYNPNIF